MTKPTVSIPASDLDKFARLATLLSQASQSAWEISQHKRTGAKPFIPTLTPPENVPEDEAWFWSEAWQKGERAANEDLKTGRYKTFETVEELLADLHEQV